MPPIFYYLTPNTHFSIITLNKPQQKQMKDKHTADRAYNSLYDCECKYKKNKVAPRAEVQLYRYEIDKFLSLAILFFERAQFKRCYRSIKFHRLVKRFNFSGFKFATLGNAKFFKC